MARVYWLGFLINRLIRALLTLGLVPKGSTQVLVARQFGDGLLPGGAVVGRAKQTVDSIDEDLTQHPKIGGDDCPPVGHILKRRPGMKVVLDTGEAV